VAVIDVLLANAGKMSDDDVLAELATYTVSELHSRRRELIQRRQQVRLIFGHINSEFLRDSLGKREYDTLVRLTDLAKVAISRKPFDAPPSIPNSKPQGRKRGPHRDYATATRVAEIIRKVAPDGCWRRNEKLDDLCEALDEAGIKRPTTWKTRKPPLTGWLDAACQERELAQKAIAHRLKNAKTGQN
jgi:hypothetical protein